VERKNRVGLKRAFRSRGVVLEGDQLAAMFAGRFQNFEIEWQNKT